MSAIAGLVDDLRRRGFSFEARGDRLHILAPANDYSPEIRAALAERRAEILALLSDEEEAIQWRVAAMRSQLPPQGPIPFLIARPDVLARDRPGACLSCGAPLEPGRTYRCALCVRAVEAVLNICREA